MQIIIITNCTSRKRSLGTTVRKSTIDCSGDLTQLTDAWVKSLQSTKQRVAVKSLYQGRSFSDCRQVTQQCDAALHVVSAGLGFVHSEDMAPNYELTISDGSGSIRQLLKSLNCGSTDWWLALNKRTGRANPISELINGCDSDAVFLVALPSTYLELVAQDLACVTAINSEKLRIFTSDAGTRVLPEHLRGQVMPYDDRLEGLPPYAGTRSDFPQRAMRHFVERLACHRKSTLAGKLAIFEALLNVQRRTIPQRVKLNNEQILELIKKNWTTSGGSATRLLRALRDDELVACEQARFRSLWRQIQAQQVCKGVPHAPS